MEKSTGNKIIPGGLSGEKNRSATSNPHKGSRVEPSHVTQQKRDVRASKTGRGVKRGG